MSRWFAWKCFCFGKLLSCCLGFHLCFYCLVSYTNGCYNLQNLFPDTKSLCVSSLFWQGAESDSSSFHIRLTYTKASDEAQGASETTHESKRRKTGMSRLYNHLGLGWIFFLNSWFINHLWHGASIIAWNITYTCDVEGVRWWKKIWPSFMKFFLGYIWRLFEFSLFFDTSRR